MNPVREKIEYALTKGFFHLLRICPAAVIYGVCRGFAMLFYALGTGRRRITMKNLCIAFPERTVRERRRIARSAYAHFGRLIAESSMVLSGKIGCNELEKMVEGDALPRLRQIEQNSPLGTLAITGHLGNFELLSHYTGSQLERRGHVVARKGSNRLIDDRLVTPMRESFGNSVIFKDRALPQVSRALKRGEHVGLLIDIKSSRRQGVPVTFFGRQTYAIKSSAYLQIKLGVQVVPVAMIHAGRGRYRLVAGDPIPWADNGQPRDEQIAELTQIHQSALEKLIRQYPEQWFWMHNRWKNGAASSPMP
jgi:KDO2-lipid IV(A) lauroyltransferase